MEASVVSSIPALSSVTAEEWERLGARRLFFGHQSVGGNLLDGVEVLLRENPAIPLRITRTADPAAMVAPGLYHAPIGQNGAPQTKLDEFSRIVGAGVGSSGTAMLKYCYVDVTKDTDPAALFDAYRRGVDSLRAAHPGLTIVHMTLPLQVDRGLFFHVRTIVRGRNAPVRELNRRREVFNASLRRTYGGREPLFDLAHFESVQGDGTVAVASYKGGRVPFLSPEWSDDGGHLNDAGKRRIAEAFLVTLAKL